MTIVLNPGQRGDSNTVSIRVSGLPEDAIITKLTVNTGTKSYQPSITIYWDDEF